MNKVIVLIGLLFLGSAVSAQLSMQKKDDGLLILEDGENVLFYQSVPKNKNGKYERCNYIHPLWGSDGTILTEDFPADHLHHRGVFWSWHQVWIDGKRIGDPWEIKDFEQEVTELEFLKQPDGLAVIKTEVEWKSELWKKLGQKTPYLKENTAITIHPRKGTFRKIDFEIKLIALEENLKIGGSDDVKGYSGFSIRMVLPEDIIFSGPAGIIEPQNTAVKSDGYVNVSGSLLKGNSKGGIVMVDHPDNPDYPQNWILRKKNSMQNAAWPGNKTISISTKEPVILRYSLIVYAGKLNDKKVQRIINE